MDGRLPLNVLDEILFRIDPKSLAMIQCINKFLQSHISKDPYFKSEYLSRIGSGLLHISKYGSSMLRYHPHGDSTSPRTETTLTSFHILGSCSGLLLLFVDGLYVANPLTKKFRLLNRSEFFPRDRDIDGQQVIGFAVDRVDRTTQSFKIVILTEISNNGNETMYGFGTNAGSSWKIANTTITCNPRNLDKRMRKPIYLQGSLYWLRNDGSIIAFDTKTEQARLIWVWFPRELSSRTLFAGDDNNLILVSATSDVIYVYALKNILSDPKWVLVRRIRNGVVDEKRRARWNVEAYDGKSLVLSEETKTYRMVRGYDLRTNKWEILGMIPGWGDMNRDYFQFSPSASSVIGLDGEKDQEDERLMGSFRGWGKYQEEYEKERLARDEKRISSIKSIMGLIDGTSSGKIGEADRLKKKQKRCVVGR